MRNTKTRQKVLDFLQSNHRAYTPYEMAKAIAMNPVTIYRILEFLREQKLVHHIPILGKWSACQCVHASKDHSFLICKKCNSVKEFLSPHHCTSHHNFHCEEHIFEVLGMCNRCSKQ